MYRTELAVALLIVSLVPAAALAQQTRDAGADGRLQAIVTQLTAERASLLADKTRLTRELDEARKELEALKTEHSATVNELESTSLSLRRNETRSEQTSARLEATEARMEELVARFRETIDTLADTETERNDFRNRLEVRDREYVSCVKSNNGLYDTGMEILAAFDGKGFFDRVGKAEPFLRLKRNQIENLIDGYRYDLEDTALGVSTADTP